MSKQAPCPACGTVRLFSFNWPLARAGQIPAVLPLVQALQEEQPLRLGALYRCRECHSSWYLDARGQFMNSVEETRLAGIERWQQHPPRASDSVLRALKQIGTISRDDANAPAAIRVPCRAYFFDGTRTDKALAWLVNEPPFAPFAPIRFIDEVERVEPSPFALPLEVREASNQSPEVAMGYSPFSVESPDGEHFTLNGLTEFLESGNVRGEQLRLPGAASKSRRNGGSARVDTGAALLLWGEATW